MSEIKLIRLVTGEEILCKMESTASGIRIKDPAIIVPVGQGKLGFAKWLPYANTEKGIEVTNSHVMFTLDADPELATQYTSMLSGLVIPNNQVATPALKISGAE